MILSLLTYGAFASAASCISTSRYYGERFGVGYFLVRFVNFRPIFCTVVDSEVDDCRDNIAFLQCLTVVCREYVSVYCHAVTTVHPLFVATASVSSGIPSATAGVPLSEIVLVSDVDISGRVLKNARTSAAVKLVESK